MNLRLRGQSRITVRSISAISTLSVAAVRDIAPQVIFHFAAQSLVRTSYRDPLATYATNVMGTLHVLLAARDVPGVEAVVVATTDKVYENDLSGVAFREQDRLGGKDPYSASKACAELLTSSFRESYLVEPSTCCRYRACR